VEGSTRFRDEILTATFLVAVGRRFGGEPPNRLPNEITPTIAIFFSISAKWSHGRHLLPPSPARLMRTFWNVAGAASRRREERNHENEKIRRSLARNSYCSDLDLGERMFKCLAK